MRDFILGNLKLKEYDTYFKKSIGEDNYKPFKKFITEINQLIVADMINVDNSNFHMPFLLGQIQLQKIIFSVLRSKAYYRSDEGFIYRWLKGKDEAEKYQKKIKKMYKYMGKSEFNICALFVPNTASMVKPLREINKTKELTLKRENTNDSREAI